MNALLLDLGNTRIKSARWDGRRLSPVTACEHGGDAAAAVIALDFSRIEQVWVASVFSGDANAALAERIRERSGLHARFARSLAEQSGLHNAYAEPARLGIDRWLSMLALWRELGRGFIVASAGTALTLDIVDDSGQHRGGYIAPGLAAMQRAVLGATRFEHRDRSQPYANTPGTDTEACVREAALAAALGLLHHLQSDDRPRFLSGGDAPTLLHHLPQHWQHRPDLVLHGLCAWGRV